MKNPLLVTMNSPMGAGRRGPPMVAEYLAMSDLEAGIVALGILGKENPNMRMIEILDLAGPQSMAGMFDFIGRQLKTVKDVFGETVRGAADLSGSAVRLAASDKVVNAATAVSSGGLLSSIPGGDVLAEFLSAVGGNFKAAVASGDAAASGAAPLPKWVPWAAAAGGVTVLALVLRPSGRR